MAGGLLDEDIDINAIPLISGYVAWNHYRMEEGLPSSFSVSGFKAFHEEDLIGGEANAAAFSISGNLKYNPVKQMMFGMELMTGYREVLNGTNGRFYRLQFSAPYSFGYKNRAVYEKGQGLNRNYLMLKFIAGRKCCIPERVGRLDNKKSGTC